MKLFSGPLSMFGAKAQIAVAEKGIACDCEMVPFDIKDRYSPKHPEVLRINPKAQVPVLIDAGLELYDSTQIFEYLEGAYPTPALWPEDPSRRAVARQLEHASDEVFFPHAVTLMNPQLDRRGPEAQAAFAAIAAFQASMNERLADRDYLAESYSYADIAFFMAQFFAAFLGAEASPELDHLDAWRSRMISREPVAHVVGPMCSYLADCGIPVPTLEGAAVDRSRG